VDGRAKNSQLWPIAAQTEVRRNGGCRQERHERADLRALSLGLRPSAKPAITRNWSVKLTPSKTTIGRLIIRVIDLRTKLFQAGRCKTAGRTVSSTVEYHYF
jgi:hypothetical protein